MDSVNDINVVDSKDNQMSNEMKRRPNPIPKPARGCIAQISPEAIEKTVDSLTNCCSNIVQSVDTSYISMKKINITILKGKVLCTTDKNAPVKEAIVVATNCSTGENYVGVTNDYGKYSICVPSARGSCDKYTIAAYNCGCPDAIKDAPCKR